MQEEIILVDRNDKIIGYGEKSEVHRSGNLHRAFSVFLYNNRRMLIQKRASGKYHSAGLWANTCCSHPGKGEDLKDAAKRRLLEEAGISCKLTEVFSFIYKHRFGDDLYEHEYDHVFIGDYNGGYTINKDEAEEFIWIDMKELRKELEETPEKFACWFQIAAPRVLALLGF